MEGKIGSEEGCVNTKHIFLNTLSFNTCHFTSIPSLPALGGTNVMTL